MQIKVNPAVPTQVSISINQKLNLTGTSVTYYCIIYNEKR